MRHIPSKDTLVKRFSGVMRDRHNLIPNLRHLLVEWRDRGEDEGRNGNEFY